MDLIFVVQVENEQYQFKSLLQAGIPSLEWEGGADSKFRHNGYSFFQVRDDAHATVSILY